MSRVSTTVLMGGGNGHNSFDENIRGRITKVYVWSGIYVDALQFEIDGSTLTQKVGGGGGSVSSLTLAPGEYISRVRTRSGHIIDWIRFYTSRGRYFAAGGGGGSNHHDVTINGRICGFRGTKRICNGCDVVSNLAFRYTSGEHRTPADIERERERARQERQRARELEKARRNADRARQEAAQARQLAERAQQERLAAERRAQEEQKRMEQNAEKARLRAEIYRLDGNMSDVQRELYQHTTASSERENELIQLEEQIRHEEAQLSGLFQEPVPSDRKVIVLLGMTGDGKSTLGNRLCGDQSEDGDLDFPFRTSGGGDSETTSVQKHFVQMFGEKICVVDTPGLADSGGRDREHVNELIHYLRGCGGVNQFVLVKNCANPRLNENFKSMLKRFEQLVGEGFWGYVTVMLTGVEGRYTRRLSEYKPIIVESISRDHQCPPVNVFGIGFDSGYQEVLRELVREAVPTERFQAEVLKSPLDELRRRTAEVEGLVMANRSEQQRIQERLHQLGREKRACQKRLNQL